ncbi:hypothetical protein DSECCO2_366190 [anaerobic digester metagenome]
MPGDYITSPRFVPDVRRETVLRSGCSSPARRRRSSWKRRSGAEYSSGRVKKIESSPTSDRRHSVEEPGLYITGRGRESGPGIDIPPVRMRSIVQILSSLTPTRLRYPPRRSSSTDLPGSPWKKRITRVPISRGWDPRSVTGNHSTGRAGSVVRIHLALHPAERACPSDLGDETLEHISAIGDRTDRPIARARANAGVRPRPEVSSACHRPHLTSPHLPGPPGQRRLAPTKTTTKSPHAR